MRWIELSAAADKASLEGLVSVLEKYGHGGASIEEIKAGEIENSAYFVKIS